MLFLPEFYKQLLSPLYLKLVVYMLYVGFYGGQGYEKGFGNPIIGQSLQEKFQNLPFPLT